MTTQQKCPNKNERGVCQMHNLQCGYPSCEQQESTRIQIKDPDAMSNEQKLREALRELIDCYSVSHSPAVRQSAWDQARQALALPTSEPIMELGESLTPEQLDELWGRYPEVREYLKRKMQEKTAAPVGERESFEQFAQNCPMGKYSVTQRGEGYDSSHTQIMWDTWQARAALAGDAAVLAEREACAKVCEDLAYALDRHKWPSPIFCAKAIRERGAA